MVKWSKQSNLILLLLLLYKIYKAPYIIYIQLLYTAVHIKVIGIKS